MMSSTIAAIATPYGKGAISIIRISGNDAITFHLICLINRISPVLNRIK